MKTHRGYWKGRYWRISREQARGIVKALRRHETLTEEQETIAEYPFTTGEIAEILGLRRATFRRALVEGRLEGEKDRRGWWRTTLRALGEALQRGYRTGYGISKDGGMTLPRARWWEW